ncbi:Astacin-like metalloendopeptidase, partial [Pseudolycoriella hygida]
GVLSAPVEDESTFLIDEDDCIVETDEHHLQKRQLTVDQDTLIKVPPIPSKKLWPRVAETGMIEIPIEIVTDDYTPQLLDVFYKGLADIENKTCIRFVDHTDEKDYVIVRDAGTNTCSANVGRIGGPQYLTFTPLCMKVKKKGVHEMIHIIGFRHMHQRFDRDDYVNIIWDNVIDEQRTSQLNTMETKDPYYQDRIGKVDTLSDADATRINRMYNCPPPYQ